MMAGAVAYAAVAENITTPARQAKWTDRFVPENICST
jgi:hypothetical protein